MGLTTPIRPIDHTSSGYGPTQQIPIAGASPPPANATPAQLQSWLKGQPWYQAALKAWNVNPNDPALSGQQRIALADAASRAGGNLGQNLGVDSSGNLENTTTPWYAKAILAATTAGVGYAAFQGLQSAPTDSLGGSPPNGSDYYGPTESGGPDTLPSTAIGNGDSKFNPSGAPSGNLNPGTTPPGSSPTSWLTTGAKLLPTASSLFAQVYSANSQLDSSKAAQQIQALEFDKALDAAKDEQDYKRGAFSSYTARLQPYANTGYASNDRLSQFMGQPPAAQTGVQSIAPAGSTPSAAPPAATDPVTPAGMVSLQAPDGTFKTVPAADAAYYISKGAKPAAAPAGT